MSRPGALTRCAWVTDDPLYIAYHDDEWGVPSHDDRHLFEMLILEGAQAGLSWLTILRKRARYRQVYEGFDPNRVARFTPAKNAELLADPGIVRNRLKIAAAVDNARAFLNIQELHGSFAGWLWSFVDDEQVRNTFSEQSAVPTRTALSDRIAKALAKHGFRFVGSTIIYSFLQAVGVVDDHITSCFRHTPRSPTP